MDALRFSGHLAAFFPGGLALRPSEHGSFGEGVTREGRRGRLENSLTIFDPSLVPQRNKRLKRARVVPRWGRRCRVRSLARQADVLVGNILRRDNS